MNERQYMYCDLLLLSCKTITTYYHVLCACYLIHHMKKVRGLNMYKMYYCKLSNQIYDIICLLYSITLYKKPHAVNCDGVM